MNKDDSKEHKTEEVSSEKEQKYLSSQKSNIELFLKYNYRDVQKITLDSVGTTPLGYYIRGYVNDDKKLNFEADLDSKGNFNGYMSMSSALEDLAKFEKSKSVEEIKKEQQETSMYTDGNPKRSMAAILSELREQEAILLKKSRS